MKTRIPLALADELAAKIKSILEPACERIEIAGSVRRRKETVGDLEFVAIPKLIPGQIDLFGQSEMVSQLDNQVKRAVTQFGWQLLKNGDKYKQLIIEQTTGVDLFITTPEQWGYILSLRTGPGEFNQVWNTQRNKGGLLPSQYRFEGGWLWCEEQRIDTPDEKEFFILIEIPWLEPSQRSAAALGRMTR